MKSTNRDIDTQGAEHVLKAMQVIQGIHKRPNLLEIVEIAPGMPSYVALFPPEFHYFIHSPLNKVSTTSTNICCSR